MMQERKIRLAIFVVIGLLVGGIILDALSRFTVVNSAIATLVRPINFIVPQCIGFFYVERDAAERKCGTQDGERRPASEQCGTHCHEGRERTAQQTSEVQGAPSQIRTHAGQGHQPGHGGF